MNKEPQVIEYEDAPGGYISLYNYKEPLMKYNQGYGFVGVLMHDTVSDKIQCHLCGKWYEALGHHLSKEHNMRTDAYKKEIGLSHKTALINERTRAKLIASGLEVRMKNLRPHFQPHSEEGIEKIRQARIENRDEIKNITNTCPDQLIFRLKAKAEELGRTPYVRELGFKEALKKTFGSYREACLVAGLQPRDENMGLIIGQQRRREKGELRNDQIVTFYREFFINNKRFPKPVDCVGDQQKLKKRFDSLSKEMRHKIKELALFGDGIYRKIPDRFNYTDKRLIDFLQKFEEINGRRPALSDCRRGLLPPASCYYYHFKKWQNALNLAFN